MGSTDATGSPGAFRFELSAIGTAATNASTFDDFSHAAWEMLDLSAIDAIAATPLNDACSFIGTAAFNGTSGQLRWQDQGRVNADTTADLTIYVKAAGPVDAGSPVL